MGATDPTKAVSPQGPPSPAERQAAVDRLCGHFARDALTASELEHRLDRAYAARTRAELAALERDLPDSGPGTSPSARAPQRRPAAADLRGTVRERDLVVSIWGGTARTGSWTPARRLTALTVMGGTELDFREAVFATDEVSVRVATVMGGVEVLVPPGVGAEWTGIALMGGVTMPQRSAPAAPDGPVIRISGLVVMGGVDVVERLPGESAREARKRRKRERKARRREGPGPWPGGRS